MRQIYLFLAVSIAFLVAFIAFSGCIHESGQVTAGEGGINGRYIYEVLVMPGAPVTNLSLMVPLPYVDGISAVADAIGRGDGMSVPTGWNIMIIDGDDAVFLKIDAPEAGKCGAAISSDENAAGCIQVSPGSETPANTACRFRIVVPAHILVPGESPAVNNPLLYPKTDIKKQNEDDINSGQDLLATRFPAISYQSLVYATYDTSESTRLFSCITVAGVIPEGVGLSGYSEPESYKTIYTDEITLDLTGPQKGWHPVNGTVIYRV